MGETLPVLGRGAAVVRGLAHGTVRGERSHTVSAVGMAWLANAVKSITEEAKWASEFGARAIREKEAPGRARHGSRRRRAVPREGVTHLGGPT